MNNQRALPCGCACHGGPSVRAICNFPHLLLVLTCSAVLLLQLAEVSKQNDTYVEHLRAAEAGLLECQRGLEKALIDRVRPDLVPS